MQYHTALILEFGTQLRRQCSILRKPINHHVTCPIVSLCYIIFAAHVSNRDWDQELNKNCPVVISPGSGERWVVSATKASVHRQYGVDTKLNSISRVSVYRIGVPRYVLHDHLCPIFESAANDGLGASQVI